MYGMYVDEFILEIFKIFLQLLNLEIAIRIFATNCFYEYLC